MHMVHRKHNMACSSGIQCNFNCTTGATHYVRTVGSSPSRYAYIEELGQPTGQTIVCDALERVQNRAADLIRGLLEMPTIAEVQNL